ncbi:MAG: DUF5808 domain-containing protein [Ktedonobacteraceae bacterium]
MNVSWPVLLLMGGLLIAIVLVLFWHPQRSRTKTSTSADRQRTDAFYRDDDRYWYGGVFYNNPDDPAVLVPKRFGLGWTVNFGHPQGKLFLIGMLLLPLVLLILNVLFFGTAPIGCHPSGCHPFP